MAYPLAMTRILYLLLFFVFAAQAEVYRLVDAHGNVSYSDQSHPEAEVIEVEELPTYTPLATSFKSNAQNLEDNKSEVKPKYRVSIVTPADDQAFWENSGTVAVQVELEPELSQARGDLLSLSLNGNQVGEPQAKTVISLTNLDRGTHTLIATVLSNSGKVLATSKPISFHLHRRSVLN